MRIILSHIDLNASGLLLEEDGRIEETDFQHFRVPMIAFQYADLVLYENIDGSCRILKNRNFEV